MASREGCRGLATVPRVVDPMLLLLDCTMHYGHVTLRSVLHCFLFRNDTYRVLAMNLTIAELAAAVDRSETYIRQHIHRKHLAVLKEGSRVYVKLDEAGRWARERGIPFQMPPSAATAMTMMPMEDRVARMTVLAGKGPDGRLQNLFTLVRHRRKDGMGPWDSEPDEDWRTEKLADDLHLLSFDTSLQRCEPIIHRVLDSGALHVNDLEVRYDLASAPRCHWAYRDERGTHDLPLRSPFKRHSAEILEYWSFADQPQKHWQEETKSSLTSGRSRFPRLGFPLDLRPDRVGNLMLARAEDAITCELQLHPQDGTLTFRVEADADTAEAYRGAVWASYSGDEVLRRQIAIVSGEALIELASDIDSVGFEVFRTADGQCIDLMSQHRIMGTTGNLYIQMGPTLRLEDRKHQFTHEVNPFHDVSNIKVNADDQGPELDRNIRRKRLDFIYHRQEASARRDGSFCRCESGQWVAAVRHFLRILAADSEPPSPIYFADPYFMQSARNPVEIKLWLDAFAATTGAPLLILCGKAKEGDDLSPWWSNYPTSLTSHVHVRIFTKGCDSNPAFHDRYLITPKREILITNSVSGWDSDGVTFIKSPYGVYRAEAERLWSTALGSGPDINVEELC